MPERDPLQKTRAEYQSNVTGGRQAIGSHSTYVEHQTVVTSSQPPEADAFLQRFLSGGPDLGNLRERNRCFVGRDTRPDDRILGDMLATASAASDHHHPTIRVLAGLPGVGKSEIAKEFAYRLAIANRIDLVWVINSQNRTTAVSDLLNLGVYARLGNVSSSSKFTERGGGSGGQLGSRPGSQDGLELVRRWLETTRVRWLLIFDNVSHPDAVLRLLPRVGEGIICLTSQYMRWESEFPNPGTVRTVDFMPLDSAVEFLLKRSGSNEIEGAEDLCEALYRLPLALEQAARIIGKDRWSFRGYLERLTQDRDPTRLDENPLEVVSRTFEIARRRVVDQSDSAGPLLNVMATLESEEIPRALLDIGGGAFKPLSVGLEDEAVRRRAIGILADYSLITEQPQGKLSIHGLVRESIRRRSSPADRKRAVRIAAEVLASVPLPSGTQNIDPNLWRVGHLLPHYISGILREIEQPTGWFSTRGTNRSVTLLDRLVLREAAWKGEVGDVQAARFTLERVLAGYSQLQRARSLDLLAARLELIRLMGDLGEIRVALDMARELSRDQAQRSGTWSPEHLSAEHEVAYFEARAQNVSGALNVLNQVLAERQVQLGDDHLDTIATLLEVARWTGELGDANRASQMTAEVALARSERLGSTHPATIAAEHEHAHWVGEAGAPEQARTLFCRVLELRLEAQGAAHPATLATRHELARWTGRAGRGADARDLFRTLLSDRRQVLGEDHPDTLAAQHEFAHWTGEAGEAVLARELTSAVFEARLRLLGLKHNATIASWHNLARWTGVAGDPSAAAAMLRNILTLCVDQIGPSHPSTMNVRSNLAYWVGQSGDLQEAASICDSIVNDRNTVLGSSHIDSLRGRRNLIYWLRRSGRHRMATEEQESLEADYLRIRGEACPPTFFDKHELAYWWGIGGNRIR